MQGNASNIRAGGASVALKLERDELTRGLRAAQQQLQQFASHVKATGSGMAQGFNVAAQAAANMHVKMWAVGASVFVAAQAARAATSALVGNFVEAGSKAHDLAQSTGASATAISQLELAATRADVPLESLAGGLGKLAKFVVSKDATNSLRALGIEADRFKKLAPEVQLESLADAFMAIENPQARVAAAMEVFGKSGAALLPLLAEGSAGLRAAREEAVRLGLALSATDIEQADSLGDAFDTLRKSVQGLGRQIGAAIGPGMIKLAQAATEVVAAMTAWVKANRPLVAQIAATVAPLAAIVAGLLAAKLAGVVLISALMPLVTAMGAVAMTARLAFGATILVARGLIGLTSLAWSASRAVLAVSVALVRMTASSSMGGMRLLAAGVKGVAIETASLAMGLGKMTLGLGTSMAKTGAGVVSGLLSPLKAGASTIASVVGTMLKPVATLAGGAFRVMTSGLGVALRMLLPLKAVLAVAAGAPFLVGIGIAMAAVVAHVQVMRSGGYVALFASWSDTLSTFSTYAEAAASTIGSLAVQAVGFVSSAAAAVGSYLGSFAGSAGAVLSALFGSFTEWQSWTADAWGWLSGLLGGVGSTLAGLWSSVTAYAGSVAVAATSVFRSVGSGLAAAVNGVKKWGADVLAWFADWKAMLTSAAGVVIDYLAAGDIQSAWDTVMEVMDFAKGELAAWFNGTRDYLTTLWTDTWESIFANGHAILSPLFQMIDDAMHAMGSMSGEDHAKRKKDRENRGNVANKASNERWDKFGERQEARVEERNNARAALDESLATRKKDAAASLAAKNAKPAEQKGPEEDGSTIESKLRHKLRQLMGDDVPLSVSAAEHSSAGDLAEYRAGTAAAHKLVLSGLGNVGPDDAKRRIITLVQQVVKNTATKHSEDEVPN